MSNNFFKDYKGWNKIERKLFWSLTLTYIISISLIIRTLRGQGEWYITIPVIMFLSITTYAFYKGVEMQEDNYIEIKW